MAISRRNLLNLAVPSTLLTISFSGKLMANASIRKDMSETPNSILTDNHAGRPSNKDGLDGNTVRSQLTTLGFETSQGQQGNTVWGLGALKANKYSKNNTFIGEDSGKSITGNISNEATGAENTGLGRGAGRDLTTGQRNILIGHEAGSLLTTGSYNIFIYAQSSSASNPKTGNLNVVIGYNAGKMLTSGERNTFIASDAGSATTTGRDNIAVGQAAMQNNTIGGGNTYLGAFSGTESGTGNNNLAAGRSALFRNTDGSGNVALGREAALGVSGKGQSPNNITVIGFQAGYSQNGLNGVLFAGMHAGYHATNMHDSVLLGRASGFNLTTGNDNVMVGAATGDNETTGNKLIYIGHQSGRVLVNGNPSSNVNNTVAIGYNASVSGSNQFQLGNSKQTIYAYSPLQVRSDERDKVKIREIEGELAVSFVRGLVPYFYKWNLRDDYVETYQEHVGMDESGNSLVALKTRILENDGSKTRKRFHAGFLAQQVETLMQSLEIDVGLYQDHKVNGGCDVKTLSYEQTIPFISKALDVAFSKIDEIQLHLKIK